LGPIFAANRRAEGTARIELALKRLLAGLETLGMKRSAAAVPMLGDAVVRHWRRH
jgi:hypothetical protein